MARTLPLVHEDFGWQDEWSPICGMDVALSPQLLRWLSERGLNDAERRVIDQVMLTAWQAMWREREPLVESAGRSPCRIWINDRRWIHFVCPGEACGLDPDDDGQPDEGYHLVPHNVDSPLQLLTLLIGVAALYQTVRAVGY